MIRSIFIAAVLLMVLLFGCKIENNQEAEIITVDVEENYPEIELNLQDFMDVDYIPLETTDDFITSANVEAVGSNVVLLRNSARDGDIFIFDKTGKALRKINRKGRSGEEYSAVSNIVLDEAKNELFVVDYPVRKILVYDLLGSYKRSFNFADSSYYNSISNYDKDNLICFKSYLPSDEAKESCHLLVSKKDGSINKEIKLPIGEIQTPVWLEGDISVTPEFCRLIPSSNSWILTRSSSDTVYNYLANGHTNPLIVTSPSTQNMNPQVFLYPTVSTARYSFMRTVKKVLNIKTFKGFPWVDLVYDNQKKAIFEYIVLNNDYSKKMPVAMKWGTANKDIATCITLNAFELVEAYEKGHLKGKLKEIASKLNEDSNPVIMLVKHKR